MVQIIATNELNRCLVMAARVGCHQDQMTRFLQAGYVPLPRGLEFHAAAREADNDIGPDLIGYAGPRGEAKSHAVIAQVGLDDCQRLPGAKWLYLRKIQKSAGEQLEDLIGKVFGGIVHGYKPSKGLVIFPNNNSKIIIGGYRSENEIDGYIGLEYDGIVLEDATTLSKEKIDKIRGSLRSSKPNWRPRCYLPANPGGVGHAWYRKLLYDPWKRKQEINTRFIYAQRGDNPFINQEYRQYLDSLTGWLRRAWRDGDFEISAGQYFNTWNESLHVIQFETSRGWRWWLAMDYGFVHWTVIYLFCEDGDGNIYATDEHAARRWLVPQHVEAIDAMLERNNITRSFISEFVAGPDVFARKGDEETISAKYERLGFELIPAKTDRINGAAEVLARLGDKENDIQQTVFISPKCKMLIDCIPAMQHDPKRPDDVLKVNADPETGEGGDDPYDAFRYGLMIRTKKYNPPGMVKYA